MLPILELVFENKFSSELAGKTKAGAKSKINRARAIGKVISAVGINLRNHTSQKIALACHE